MTCCCFAFVQRALAGNPPNRCSSRVISIRECDADEHRMRPGGRLGAPPPTGELLGPTLTINGMICPVFVQTPCNAVLGLAS